MKPTVKPTIELPGVMPRLATSQCLPARLKPKIVALAISQALLTAVPAQAAVINVDPPGTPGGCTIIEAVTTANSDGPSITCVQGSGPDSINLPANTTFALSAGLAGGVSGDVSGDSGLPVVTSIITINGNDSTITRDAGAVENFRLVEVVAGNLSLNDITLSGAVSDFPGGGLSADFSTISLTNSTISGNTSSYEGGGISVNRSSLSVVGSIVSENYSSLIGGGIHIKDIAAANTTEIINSSISDNYAYSSGGGIWTNDTSVSVSNSTISENVSRYGGGLSATGSSILTLTDTTISANYGAYGGGVGASSGASVSLLNSTISSNIARYGGGLRTESSSIALTDSTVFKNAVSRKGGGIFVSSSTMNISSSTVSGNTATTDGGGIFTESGDLKITNSTVSGNSAKSKGGGVFVQTGTTATLLNNTLFNNKVVPDGIFAPIDSGGGLYVEPAVTGLTLSNTVIANSLPRDCGGQKPGAGLNNWFQDISCAGINGIRGNPLLGRLEFNGGPTKTHAPLPNSGLEGGGNGFVCQVAPVNNIDQRGKMRHNPCFIGAVDEIIDPSSFFVVPLGNGKSVIFSLSP